MKRISVDFNTIQSDDERARVYINTGVHPELLKEIAEGMRVIFFDEKLEVDGTIEFDEQYQKWCGQPDWTTRRDT